MNDENLLRIHISNTDPIDLNILSNSLNAYASQYDSFLQKKNIFCKKSDRKLLVKEVKQGSIIIDIFASVLPVSSDLFYAIPKFNPILEFGTYLKDTMDFFTKKGEKKYDYSKKDCQDHINSLEMTAKDSDGNINVSIINKDGTVYAPIFIIKTMDSNASQMIAKKYADDLSDNEYMQSFAEKTLKLIASDKNIIKGLIEDFSDKPLTLTYHSEDLRQRMINDKENNPFTIYYIVNGELIKAEKGSKIIAYKILEIKDAIID